jgi:hypothetical protein
MAFSGILSLELCSAKKLSSGSVVALVASRKLGIDTILTQIQL